MKYPWRSALVFVAFIVVGISGCGSSSASGDSPSAPAVATPAGPTGTITVATFTGDNAQTTAAFHIDAKQWLIQYQVTAQNCSGASLGVFAYNSADAAAFVRNVQVTGCVSDAVKVLNGPGDFFLKITPGSVVYTIQVVEVR